MRIVLRDKFAQGQEPSVNRVAVLLFADDAHRLVADDVWRRQIGLAQAEVDAARAGAVEDLPDDALLDAAQTTRREKIAQRKISSNCAERSVFSSRYLTMTGVYRESPH